MALLICCAVLPAATQAKPRASSLWATVNACDTAAHPDTIGIRASMPGSSDGRGRMFMRFQVQYLSGEDFAWHSLAGAGDSGYVEVGRANVSARQKGRYVTIAPSTDSIIVRGVVSFQWRRNGKVVRRAQRRTRAGHKSKAGADPANYSRGSCKITR